MASTDDIWKDAFDRLSARLKRDSEEAAATYKRLSKERAAATTDVQRADLGHRLEMTSYLCHEINSAYGTANSLKNWANAQVAKGNGP